MGPLYPPLRDPDLLTPCLECISFCFEEWLGLWLRPMVMALDTPGLPEQFRGALGPQVCPQLGESPWDFMSCR